MMNYILKSYMLYYNFSAYFPLHVKPKKSFEYHSALQNKYEN